MAEARAAHDAGPGETGPLARLVDALRNAGALSEAAVRLADLSRRAPDAPATWMQRGLFLRATDRVEEALAVLADGAARHPDHLGLAIQHAITLRHAGRPEDAARALAVLRETEPEHPGVLGGLVEALRDADRPGEARTVLEALTRLQPDAPGPAILEGLLLRAEGRPEAAAEALAAAAARFPDNPASGLHAAMALRLVRRSAEALAMLEALAARFPGHLGIGLELAAALRQAGRREEAAACRTRLVDLVAECELPPMTREALDLATPALVRQIEARRQPGPPAVASRVRAAVEGGDRGEGAAFCLPASVLVIGMHRAGTSAVARALRDAGGRVPGTEMPGDRNSNPEGHFEPWEVVAFHNRALMARGLSWHSVGGAPAPGYPLPDSGAERRALARLLAALPGADGSEGPPVIKDPRLCRLLALWEPVAPADGPVLPLLVLRSPTAIAESLVRRDGMSRERAHLLWARYHAEALASPLGARARLLVHEETDTPVLADAVAGRFAGLDPAALGRLEPRAAPEPDGSAVDRAYADFVATRDAGVLQAALEALLAPLDAWPEMLAEADRAVLTTRS